MAGRGHVDVNERRLRPVYDALDNLNNKLAIQLADKILKKQRNLHCAKALKALALLRSNRTSECEEILEELKQINIWDDSILQCMTMTYKEMNEARKIAEIYELAVAQHPKNEEFLSHLFMSYVRIGDNIKQQKAAMSLYKAFPFKNPYYFWAIMSIYMQAVTSDDEKAVKSMLLPLAERMVTKYVKDKRIEAKAEVQLYLMILEKSEKYQVALQVLEDETEGSIGNLINDKQEIMVKYLEKLERWSDVNSMYKMMLKERPDQWSYYVGYLDSSFKLIEQSWSPDGEEKSKMVDNSLDKINEFLNTQLENNSSLRGPYLARLEYQKRIRDQNQDCQEEIINQLIIYYDKFGSRNCCFNDVSSYVDLLSDEQGNQFIKTIKGRTDEVNGEASCADKVKALQRVICIECMERRLGHHESFSTEEKIAKAKELMKRHRDGLELGQDLLSTDIQPVDNLALLAVFLLMRCKEGKDTRDKVWHILLLLEEAVKHSPSNHEFKLLLMDMYCSIGAFGPAKKLSEELEIKYIMLDTLGYKLTRFAQPLCHFQSAASCYASTLKFFSASQKDIPEQIVAAYKYGAFRKIPEIIEFRDRLSYSIQFSLVVFEKLHLDLLQQANSVDEMKNFIKASNLLVKCPSATNHFDGLLDNRDFNILNFFDLASRQVTDSQKSVSYSQEILWIRYRCLMLRLIGIAYEITSCKQQNNITNGVGNDDVKDMGSDLLFTLNEMENVITKSSDGVIKESEFSFSVHGPSKSQWNEYLNGKYTEPVLIMATVLKILQVSEDKINVMENEIENQMKKLDSWFQDSFKSCQDNILLETGDQKIINGPHLAYCCLLVETCNYVIIMLSLILEPLRKRFRKPRKKKAPSPTQASNVTSKK